MKYSFWPILHAILQLNEIFKLQACLRLQNFKKIVYLRSLGGTVTVSTTIVIIVKIKQKEIKYTYINFT